MGRSCFEFFKIPGLTKEKINSLIECPDIERFKKISQNGSAIFLMPHFGNWELSTAFASLNGMKAAVMAKRIYYAPYNDFIAGLRESKGTRVIYTTDGLKQLFGYIKKKYLIGILPDQNLKSKDNVPIKFFGREAPTTTFPARLAVKTGLPIVPCFFIKKDKGYKFIIEKEIRPSGRNTEEKEILEITENWSKMFESYIRQYPDQWVWFHRRW